MASESDSQSVVAMEGLEEDIPLPPLTDDLQKEFEKWRRTGRNYRNSDFMRYLLHTDELKDVTFLVRSQQNGEVERIMAHQKILESKSPFFKALVSGRWEADDVDLTNTEIYSTDFKIFLQYLYFKQVTLTSDNVLALLYMAYTYQVEDLKSLCHNFLSDNIDEDNALTVFPFVHLHDENKSCPLLRQLADVICRNGQTMLEKSEMLGFNANQLSYIFTHAYERGNDSFKTMALLRFAFRWIAKKYGRKTFQQFELLDDILSYQLSLRRRLDRDNIRRFTSFITRRQLGLDFSQESKPIKSSSSTVYEVNRFGGINENKRWVYRRNRSDRISFRCSESIMLVGIGLYGDRQFYQPNCYSKRLCTDEDVKPKKYDVDIDVYYHGKSQRKLLSVFRRGGEDMDVRTGIYKVDLTPIFIPCDELCTISVKISGDPSSCGERGTAGGIFCLGNTGLLFEFQEASDKDPEATLSNPTGVPIGQVPILYFKLIAEEEDDLKVLE